MKTDFPVIWVDDNKDFVTSLQTPIQQWIDGHGFELKVTYFKNSRGLLESLKSNEAELIIIDLNMPGKKGDEVIREIRENDCFHDIIFYTQGVAPHESFKNTAPPDGVFFVERGDARDRIKDLIKLKIRRASDLATMRGWVVADAIELEAMLGLVLAKCFRDMEPLFHNRVLAYEGLFDCAKKYYVLSGILKDFLIELNKDQKNADRISRITACKKVLDAFLDEVIHVRNALAHQVAEEGAEGKKIIRTKTKAATPIEFTEQNCAKIRKNLRRHQANLTELLALV